MIDKIKIIDNIISKEDAEFLINWIDKNESMFDTYEEEGNPLRLVLRFGLDYVYPESNETMAMIFEIHDVIKRLEHNICREVEKVYQEENSLYITSLHVGKQLPGSRVDTHVDADPNNNGHFKHSCVVYLNEINNGGDLFFTKLNYHYHPLARQAAVFPSQGPEYEHEVSSIGENRYNLPIWITEDLTMKIKYN